MNTGKITSGYTEDIVKEMSANVSMPVESEFHNLRECNVSASGHTRLFFATRYGKRYMLKCLKRDFLYIPVYIRALIKEFEIGLQMDHPNICRTIGMEEIKGLGTTIVMEHIDGETLESVINRKSLTAELARKVANQTIDALAYVHGKQTVHRDLKPSNIMITHNGHDVKLIDFSLSDSDSFDILKLPAGTSGYIAPELLIPGANADARTDVYSFGKILEEMAEVTGDKAMMKVAQACANRCADKRPASVLQIKRMLRGSIALRISAILLACAAVMLAAYIAVTLYHRMDMQGEQLPDTVNITSDGNEAVDFDSWP